MHIVRGFLAARPFHIFNHNVGLSRDIFLQEGDNGFNPISSQPAWRLADDSFDGLAFVIGSLRQCLVRDERADQRRAP